MDQRPVAKGILTALKNDIFKLYFLFLAYVLDLVTKINLEFQAEDPKIPFLLERVSSLYKLILKNFIKKEVLTKQSDLNRLNVTEPQNYLDINNIYYGAKVDLLLIQNKNLGTQEVQNFKVKALHFYVELCVEIKKRFNFSDQNLQFASLFTPQVALSGNVLSIVKFKNLYPTLDVDIELANTEWQLLGEMDSHFSEYKNDLTQFWTAVSEKKNSLQLPMFANLMNVVKYVLTLPHSSAACERMFSLMALIKSKLRNKLLINTCSSILHVKDHSSHDCFNYDELKKCDDNSVQANEMVTEMDTEKVVLDDNEIEIFD